jgi:hypothetical protein
VSELGNRSADGTPAKDLQEKVSFIYNELFSLRNEHPDIDGNRSMLIENSLFSITLRCHNICRLLENDSRNVILQQDVHVRNTFTQQSRQCLQECRTVLDLIEEHMKTCDMGTLIPSFCSSLQTPGATYVAVYDLLGDFPDKAADPHCAGHEPLNPRHHLFFVDTFAPDGQVSPFFGFYYNVSKLASYLSPFLRLYLL